MTTMLMLTKKILMTCIRVLERLQQCYSARCDVTFHRSLVEARNVAGLTNIRSTVSLSWETYV